MFVKVSTIETIRAWLLALLIFGMGGTAIELVLLGHYDGAWQLVPLALLGAGFLVVAWHLVRPSAGTIRGLEATMAGFLVAGVIGVFLHYQGSLEFQLEVDPTQQGWPLFMKVMHAKAPPALAPGVMAQLGLLGLVYAYRHPASARSGDPLETEPGAGARARGDGAPRAPSPGG
jgi:hypothetical protein